MLFQEGYLYHIYNQGNNRQKIFFNRENYFFFLKKIKKHIHPYADIIAWCLMPNHFHLMVLVKEIGRNVTTEIGESMTFSRSANESRTPTSISPTGSLNKSIGIMLASYTRAINNQNNTTGSLFRDKTKAECINCPDGVTPSYVTGKDGITRINIKPDRKQYPQICFDYIHKNPVKAKLVLNPTEWEFSSARDYVGLQDGKLINMEIAKEYVKF